jgi:hypothetical protein
LPTLYQVYERTITEESSTKDRHRVMWMTGFTLSSAVLCLMLGCSHRTAKPAVAMSVPDADRSYQEILRTWGAGDQRGAEHLADRAVSMYPEDQRLALFQAACIRSRFEVTRAYPLFVHVNRMNASTVQGVCATHIAQLDSKGVVEEHFDALRNLVQQNPTDPILLWMLAVQCRA